MIFFYPFALSLSKGMEEKAIRHAEYVKQVPEEWLFQYGIAFGEAKASR